ncbi:ABC superfamily ATP binding cassette transporter, extracellular solute-binding protein, partial [human gut metagenome]
LRRRAIDALLQGLCFHYDPLANRDSEEVAADGSVTITYMNFSANGGHEEDLQAIADAFHEENPQITVTCCCLINC